MASYEWVPASAGGELQELLERHIGLLKISARKVRGGRLRAIVSCEPPENLWHMSLSFQPKRDGHKPRFPDYDEIVDARYQLLPGNLNVVLFLPPLMAMHADEINNTVHLWEHRAAKDVPQLPPGPPAGDLHD
jgi:hypothetical protein